MTDLEKLREDIIKNIKKSSPPTYTGGQSCGKTYPEITLESEEVNFKVTIGMYRTQHQNWELAKTLFELALDEFLKL